MSVRPNTGGFELWQARLKTLLNRALAHLPGRPEPFDERVFRVDLRARKLWELPPEVRPQVGEQDQSKPESTETVRGKGGI